MQRQSLLLKLKNNLFKKRKALIDILFVVLLVLFATCTKPSVSPQASGPSTLTPTSPGVPVPYSLDRQRIYGTFGTCPSAFVQTKDGGSVIVSTETNTGYGISILKLDPAGNQIWYKTISIDTYEQLSTIALSFQLPVADRDGTLYY